MREGVLKPKIAISLASLARELDVSVTPIREALTQLQTSGLVEAIPNRGFFIPELDKSEAKNLYELVASLESLAVQNSIFSSTIIKKLKKYNETFNNATDKIKRINSDIEFHNVLTSNYKNPIALRILSELKTRIFFYEVDFMSQEGKYKDSENEHNKIIQHIIAGNLDEACIILKNNWLKAVR